MGHLPGHPPDDLTNRRRIPPLSYASVTGSFFTNRFHVQLPVLGSGSENGPGTAV
jgi:hypothetical protein